MNSKTVLQTFGTLASIIFGIISIELLQYTKATEGHGIALEIAKFSVLLFTIYIMARTGSSFLKARKEYEGINYFLSICLSLVLIACIPALIITGLVIDFGGYWLVVLIGIIILIAWAKRNENMRRRAVVTVG
ncbi:hypothetical protein ACXYMX_16655 [Sporosarcina sp. CAU 1771]